jgi:hypothetical protein
MSKDNDFPGWHGTTIVAVRKGNKVVIAGDEATIHYNQAKLVGSGGGDSEYVEKGPHYLATMNRQLVAELPDRFRRAA